MLKGNFFAFFDFSFITDKDEEGSSFFGVFQMILFLFSVVVISLMTHRLLRYKGSIITDDFSSFINVFGYLFAYFLLKRILEFGFSFLFLIRERIQFFIISKSKYFHSLAFLLYIIAILSEYAEVNQLYAYCFAGFLFVIRSVLYSIRNKKLIFNNLFYYILYICTFEIAPLFVLFKLMF